jgi:dipeptidyl aminopeptidase/acylaminoacyl peptidase
VTSDEQTRVRAAGVFFPMTDLLNWGGNGLDARSDKRVGQRIRRLVSLDPSGNEAEDALQAKLAEISPARQVTQKAPPFLLIHGDADPVVPLQQSEVMVDALKKAGASAELIVKKGGGHPWLTIHEEVRILADWFDKHLLDE